jgi:thiamine-phosphate pyrophosphorylase
MHAFRGLYAITDDHLLQGRLLDAVAQALAGGCRVIQYRSKLQDPFRQRREAGDLLGLCQERGAILLINDNVALARDIGAHGVHLGQDDMTVAVARAQLGQSAIIGVTCHASLALARAAQAAGANYVAFGRFFPSGTKPSAPPAPLSVLTEAHQQLTLPVVAIGGITLDNAASALTAGADLLAVAGDLFSARDIAAHARAYTALFELKDSRNDPL